MERIFKRETANQYNNVDMSKKEVVQVRCRECKYSKPFSELVISCERKEQNFVGNSLRICSSFIRKAGL